MAHAAAGPDVKRARWRRRIALGMLATSCALLAGELALRRFDPEQAPLRLQQLGIVLQGDPREQFLDLVVPDPELFWRLAPNVRLAQDRRPFYGLISNAQGLREDHEIPAAKPAGELRVLFLGDSVTFGYLLRSEESFVQVAEDELRALLPGTPIECINAGVPGYSLFQGWRWLETRAAAFHPDLVVLEFGWNDMLPWDGLSDFESQRRFSSSRPPGVLSHSRLARKLWSLRSRPAPPTQIRPRLTTAEFGQLLGDCKRCASSFNAELMVLITGSRGNLLGDPRAPMLSDYQKQQYAFAVATGVAKVDGVEVVRRLGKTLPVEKLFLDELMHPSAELNRAVGEALAERIAAWRRAREPK